MCTEPILWLPAHQLIAHTTADQQGATANIADGPSDFRNQIWNFHGDSIKAGNARL